MPVSSEDFIYRDKEGKEFITTRRLPEYYENWKRRDYGLRKEAKGIMLNKTAPSIRKANMIVLHLHRRYGDQSKTVPLFPLSSLCPELLLSLQLIGSALTIARSNIYAQSPDTLEDRISFRYHWGYSKLMLSHILRLGWCRSIAAAFESKQLDVQCYAASLEPPRVKKDHSHCSARKCLANQVNEEDYQVKHVSQDCICEVVSPVLDQVVSIIEKRRIPLIELTADIESSREGELHDWPLRAIAYQPGLTYVAISHVWKDGLGNPVQNSLPGCQFRRLQRVVREMYADKRERGRHHDAVMTKFQSIINKNEDIRYSQDLPPIWIDTLCVPVRGELQDVRKKAVKSMQDVYRRSDKVLVLDEELQQMSLDKLSWKRPLSDRVEFMFRFTMSGWNSRLWTLLEGRLGNDLYLLLSDGVVRAKDLFFRSTIDYHRLHNINDEGNSLLTTICMTSPDDFSSQELALGRMIIGLRNRQTSRESDETICMINMLGGDPSQLANTNAEQRMLVFLKSLRGVPPSILFMGEPRSRVPGFRWSPTSFLYRRDRCYDTQRFVIQYGYHPNPERPAGRILSDGSGLRIESPGIELNSFGALPDANQFTIDLFPSKPLRLQARYDLDPLADDVSWQDIRVQNFHRTAALVIGDWALNYRDPVDCVLVALRQPMRDSEGCKHANVICSYQIFEARGPEDIEEPVQDSGSIIPGTWYDHQQAWILD